MHSELFLGLVLTASPNPLFGMITFRFIFESLDNKTKKIRLLQIRFLCVSPAALDAQIGVFCGTQRDTHAKRRKSRVMEEHQHG